MPLVSRVSRAEEMHISQYERCRQLYYFFDLIMNVNIFQTKSNTIK